MSGAKNKASKGDPFKDGFVQADLRLVEFPGYDEPWAVYEKGDGWLKRIGDGQSIQEALLDGLADLEGTDE